MALEPLGVVCRAYTHIEVWTAGPLQKDRGVNSCLPLPRRVLENRR